MATSDPRPEPTGEPNISELDPLTSDDMVSVLWELMDRRRRQLLDLGYPYVEAELYINWVGYRWRVFCSAGNFSIVISSDELTEIDTGVRSWERPNVTLQEALVRVTRWIGTVPRYIPSVKPTSESPGPENQTEDPSDLIERINLDVCDKRSDCVLLKGHFGKCDDVPF